MRADRELFEAWSAGDQDAGSQLIDRHYDAIVRFFRTKSPSAVDDLTQRTFLRCAEVRSRFRGEASVRTFLFGIARNVLFEHIRGRVRDARVCPDVSAASLYDLDPGVHTQASERDDHRVLLAALHRLPLDLQLLLELYYWEHMTGAEIAAVLDVPAPTVRGRLRRARKALAEAVESVAQDPEIARRTISSFESWAASVRKPFEQE